jgi:hypothetical protein
VDNEHALLIKLFWMVVLLQWFLVNSSCVGWPVLAGSRSVVQSNLQQGFQEA